MECSFNSTIAAQREKVFDLLYDEDKMKQWMPELVANIYPNGRNINHPVGTRFTQKLREGGRVQVYDGEVIAYEPGRHLGIRLGNHAFSMDVHYRLYNEGEGTRLEYTCIVEFKGWFYRLIGKTFFGFMKKMAKSQMERLKKIAEG